MFVFSSRRRVGLAFNHLPVATSVWADTPDSPFGSQPLKLFLDGPIRDADALCKTRNGDCRFALNEFNDFLGTFLGTFWGTFGYTHVFL